MTEPSPKPFDYRKILVAYICHVGTQEGIDFLGNGSPWVQPMNGLTLEETNVLVSLAKEADKLESP